MQKRALVISVLVALAVIVAVIVIAVAVSSSKASTKSSDADKRGNSPDATAKPNVKDTLRKFKKDNTSSGSSDEDEETTDPLTEKYSVSALAIGDWGRTIAKDGGSCCSRRKSFTVLDYNAMEYVAILLGQAAAVAQPRPSVVIGHGDNFYWDGLHGKSCEDAEAQSTGSV
ncbi:hypothetical protein PC116_g20499 [Phytophthora cactorum]|nr:hypothetical protein PC116_g20499 [Phytophthora cactorum]